VGLGPKQVYTPNAFLSLDPKLSCISRWLIAFGESHLAQLSDAIIAVSDQDYQHARKIGITRQRLHLIPNGIRLRDPGAQSSSREALRHAWNIPSDHICIGYVGRLVRQKAPELLLQALALIQKTSEPVVLAIVGYGPLSESLRRLAQELQIEQHVRWVGEFASREAMMAFDIFALPSRYEGFPYVLLEAMAAGLPVIATNVGGVEMAISNGRNGFIVPVGSYRDFTERIQTLLGDANLRFRMKQEALKRAERFTADEMVRATEALYMEILGAARETTDGAEY